MAKAEAAAPDLEQVRRLAAELGWKGVPEGEDAQGLWLLLDDELERLPAKARARFVERLKQACPQSLGVHVFLSDEGTNLVLARYLGDEGRDRVSGQQLQTKGGSAARRWQASLPNFLGGGERAKALGADGAAPAAGWELARERKLAKAFKLEAENEDWDALQEAIVTRRAGEEQQRREAEEKKRKEGEERARKAAEEKKKRDEEERKKREAAEKLAAEKGAKEAEERKKREAAEALTREAEEKKRLAEREKTRPALGCVVGPKPGEVIRIPDLPAAGAGGKTGVWVEGGAAAPVAKLHVGDRPATVSGKAVKGVVVLEKGAVVSIGDDEEVYAIEETQEMGAQVAEPIHFARNDKEPGGPWAYWNEELSVGATSENGVQVVDDGVADKHARVATRFGVVALEDLSGKDDGVFVGGKRKKAVLLWPDTVFQLGKNGPALKVGAGEAKQKETEKAKAMKPSRHTRTVFEIKNAEGKLVRKIFVFTRREVRFGSRAFAEGDETRMINELTLTPGPNEQAEIAEKQGGLALTRDGVELRRDGGAPMWMDGEPLDAGKAVQLTRRFALKIGEGMELDGRVYRSPTGVVRDRGPATLGMKGGHPYECLRLDRKKTPHTYVFLVRMLRIGSEAFAPLRLTLPGVMESHCQIMFAQGKFLIVAPKADAPVFLGDVEMDPGVAFPLEIDTDIHVGEAVLHFRVVEESDFVLE